MAASSPGALRSLAAIAAGSAAAGFGWSAGRDIYRKGKEWILPAWTAAERKFAVENKAAEIVVSTQTMIFRGGIQAMQKTLADEQIIAS